MDIILEYEDWPNFTQWWRDEELIDLTSGNHKFLSDDEIKKQVQEMANSTNDHHWLIEADNKIVGHVNLSKLRDSKTELQIVIGEKNYWGKGIGKYAIEQVLENAKKLDFKEIYIEVRPENLRARNLYKSVGFIENGTKKYRSKYLPEIITMSKTLIVLL